MLLSLRALENVVNVNTFQHSTQLRFTEGDAPVLYFQLIDASTDLASQGFVPAGRRYVPAAGATLELTLNNIDDARRITRFATQPFANDLSIWALTLTTADKIRGTVNVKVKLTEGSTVRYGLAQALVLVDALDGMTRL